MSFARVQVILTAIALVIASLGVGLVARMAVETIAVWSVG